MREMRKILAYLLMFIFSLSLLTNINIDMVKAEIYGDFTYSVKSDGTIEIMKYLGTVTYVTIPEEIDGKKVTSIGQSAFERCRDITNIEIPKGVTSIGRYAFYGCSSLTNIEIPEGVTSIGESAFYSCTRLTSIEIPESVTSIRSNTFYGCSQLISIEIPKEVKSIGYSAFYNCIRLTSVEIPEGITSIEGSVFFRCSSLTNIKIPESVTSIGSRAFYGCSLLKSIEIPEGVTTIKDEAFEECSQVISIKIPKKVTSIGENVFKECNRLKEIKVNEENNYYFDDNGVLYSKQENKLIRYPQNLNREFYNILPDTKDISIGAFYDCFSLENIEIPEGVTSIREYAFYGCRWLSSIEIPESVTSIGEYAFYDTGFYSINIPGGVRSIESSAFSNCRNLTKVNISKGVTSIGPFAFNKCSNLRSIEIPEGVTSIGGSAFYKCSDLKSIKIPEGVTSIEYDVFNSCSSLESIVIPKSVNEISSYAFMDSGLKIIYGEKGSYAEEYAHNNNIYFRLISELYGDKISSDYTIPIDKYGIIVKDENGTKIVGAKVNLDDIVATTDNNGIALFNNNFSFEDRHSISFEYGGYYSYNQSLFEINKSKNYSNIVIYSTKNSPHKLQYAFYSNKSVLDRADDILNLRKVIYKSNPASKIYLSFYVLGNDWNVERYELWQGNKLIKTEKENSSFIITTDDVKETSGGNNLKIKVYDKDGKCTINDLNLEIYNNRAQKSAKLELGDIYNKFSVSIPDDIPFIGNSTFSVDMPELPVTFAVTEDTVRFGINLSKKTIENMNKNGEKEWDDLRDSMSIIANSKAKLSEISDAKNMSFFPGESKFKVNVVGYLEAKYAGSDKPTEAKGQLYFIFDYSFSKWGQTMISVVPITCQLTLGANATINPKLTYNYETDKWKADGTINLKTYLEAFGGVGVAKVASVGGFARGDIDLGLSSENFGNYLDLTLQGGFKASVGPFSYKKSWLNETWNLYSDTAINSRKTTQSVKANASTDSMYNISNYSLMDRNYLDKKSNWLGNADLSKLNLSLKGETIESNGEVIPLIKETFSNSSPKVVSSKNNTVMVYVDDDKSRNEYNIGKLVYSIYDGTSGTWSNPVQIDSNNTSDNKPYLYTDGNDIYVIYQDAQKVFTNIDSSSDEKFSDYTKSLGVTVGKFNPSTKKFENVTTLSTSSTYNSQPKVSVINGIPTAVWVSNINGNYFGTNSTNSIVYSEFVSGKWSSPKTLSKNLNCITDINVGTISNNLYVSYCLDGDNNLDTIDDRTLNVIDKSGVIKKISSGLVSNPVFAVMPDTSLASLVWYENGNINSTNNLTNKIVLRESGINKLSDNFTIVANKIIYYNSDDDDNDNSNIYMSTYNKSSKTWSDSIKVTNQDKYIKDISVTEIENSLLTTFIQSDITVTENDVIENSDLCYSIINEVNDISLENIYYEFSNITPNENLKLYLDVKNNGENTVNNLVVEIKDSSNNMVQRSKVNKTILSSETQEIEVDFLVPSELSNSDYTVTVYEDGINDNNIEDNSNKFNIGYTDLSLNTTQVTIANKNYILAEIKNESNVKTAGKLNVYAVGNSEIPVATKTIKELGAGETGLYYIELEDTYFKNGNEGIVNVTISSDEKEYYDTNNSEDEYVYNRKNVTFINEYKEYYVGECVKDGTISILPNKPINTEKSFLGWYISDGKEFTSETVVSKDITVYAKWGEIVKTVITSFKADKVSPQVSGTKVKLSVEATGSGTLQYKYLVKDSKGNWYRLKDYSTSNTLNWTTNVTGDKTLYVDVRNSNGDVTRAQMSYKITEKIVKPVITSFKADKASPQVSGTKVKLSVEATGSGTLQYKYLVKDSKGNWYRLKDYSTSNTLNWTTSVTGDKTLYVDVKNSNGDVTRAQMSYKVNN